MRTIAHISDIHFGKIDLRIADALATMLHESQPSLLIVSGDLTQRARAWQFHDAAAYLNRLTQPQLIVPGNHDVPLYDVIRRFFAPTQWYRRYITDNLVPVYQDEELCVVGLNSARAFTPRWRGFWKDGAIDARQVESACELFAATKASLKTLVTHHPFVPVPGGDPEDRLRAGPEDLNALRAAGVDLLLAGHLHRSYSSGVPAAVAGANSAMLSIQAGTATSTRVRDVPNSFNLLRTERDRIELLVYRWNGVTFTADEPQHFLRNAAGWRAK